MSDGYYTERELRAQFGKRRKRRRRSQKSSSSRADSDARARRLVRAAALASLVLAATIVVFLFFLSRDTPSFEQLENPDLSMATVVYTADGEVLTRYALQDRTPVPLDSISQHMTTALVATEDYRFYDHWGIDVFRTVVSVAKTVLGDQQGGSTITQQLARNLYREQVGNEVSITRKLKEWMTAIQLERRYTKSEILEMYLNTVEWGYNTYGIQTASLTFFGVPASQLRLHQAATLVGMLKGPSRYNPVRHPERAKTRRDVVLNQMVRFGDLEQSVADSTKSMDLALNFNRLTHVDNPAPFFAEEVRHFVDNWAEENGYNTYTDGLVVHTTLDSRVQRLARKAVDDYMPRLQAVADVEHSSKGGGFFSADLDPYVRKVSQEDFPRFDRFWSREKSFVDDAVRQTERYSLLIDDGMSRAEAIDALRKDTVFMDSLKTEYTRLELGLVAVDPMTRHVKAWVGGRDYGLGKLDHVSGTRRQPGSTFKPFLYTAAIDNGYSPYYSLLDDSVTIMMPGMPEPWSPSNSGDKFSGRMLTLRDGLRMSRNTIAARLVNEVGPEQVKAYASRMGVASPLEPVPSIALGTSDVTLLEMTNAYATLANGGFAGNPILVTSIADRSGRILADFVSQQEEALSEYTAYTMIDMLRGVLAEGGTGIRVRRLFGVTEDVAGKTGTTQNGADGWFVMMHPEIVMGAWVGFNQPAIRYRTSYWGQGGHTALYLVGDLFRSMARDKEIKLSNRRFEPPSGWSVPLPLISDLDDSGKIGGKKKGRVGW